MQISSSRLSALIKSPLSPLEWQQKNKLHPYAITLYHKFAKRKAFRAGGDLLYRVSRVTRKLTK